MFFKAYTGGRPAEFVHSSKGKASQDPLGDEEEADKAQQAREIPGRNNNDGTLDFDDDSDAGNGPRFDDDGDIDCRFDSDEDDVDEDTDAFDYDSGYGTEETDATMTE